MISGCTNLPPLARKPARTVAEAGVLAAARAAQADVHAAEARKLAAAVQWARLHEVEEEWQAATWGDSPLTLGGEGCPLVAYGCIGEFAAVIGTSTNGGRAYLADALELAYRLPLLYARIQSGRLPAWKGRRIANESVVLPPDAAAVLDERIAPIAGRLSARATQQMIDETIVEFMPDYAQELADRNTAPRVIVDHRQVSFDGTSTFYGALELPDALDLDAALDREAAALAEAGCEASLDVRRAMAMGRLARGEAGTVNTTTSTTTSTGSRRKATLFVHLPADTPAMAMIENGGDGRLLTQATVAKWLGKPDTSIIVKPVIDLHDRLATAGYDVPDRIREHVELRDGTCVFAYCDKPARRCQVDHITAYDHGGVTDTDNLAALCQHHHNLKTHGGWTYTMVEPGVFLWRSPHGYTFLRDHHGTRDLTPRPVDPPGEL